MQPEAENSSGTRTSVLRDFWNVGFVLILSLAATFYGYILEREEIRARNQLRFEQISKVVENDLRSTMLAYGQFLRGGVALFHASDSVRRDEWRNYVRSLELEENYPGIQGVGYNAVLQNWTMVASFQDEVRTSDWPGYQVAPQGERQLYAPVLYVEPLTPANETALGYDIYSERNRRDAIDAAIASGQPRLTAKLTLVNEDQIQTGAQQAAVLLLHPVFAKGADLSNAAARTDATTGFVVSVFRMGDLVTGVLSQNEVGAADMMTIELYDAADPNPETLLYASADSGPGQFSSDAALSLFGRNWLLRTQSTDVFDRAVYENEDQILLAGGILVSLLLSSMVWGMAARNIESRQAAESLSASNKRVEHLMRETNHRSKNLLGLVQAIARQTSAGNPQDFAISFSKRLGALSSSQDLLVKSQWTKVNVDELIRTQVSHFGGLVGSRIQIHGDTIGLKDSAAQTIGMAIHELATNAGKYGAMASDAGTVSILWKLVADPVAGEEFYLSWIERGGPPAVEPKRKGFGSTVSVAMVKHELRAEIETRFGEDGFEWHLKCPASSIKYTERDHIAELAEE